MSGIKVVRVVSGHQIKFLNVKYVVDEVVSHAFDFK